MRDSVGKMHKRKKILIFNAGPIFPVKGMHQVRVFNQIKSLNKDHDVSFMFMYTRKDARDETYFQLKSYCQNIESFRSFPQKVLFRALKKIFLNKIFERLAYPIDYFSYSNILTSRLIAGKVKYGKYDIVISHYWVASGFLKYLPDDIFSCIDTHYLVEENLELFFKGQYSHLTNKNLKNSLEKELSIQKKCFQNINLIIVNSMSQKDILKKQGINNVKFVPNGQDLRPFLDYKIEEKEDEKKVLFYGSLANQFNQKALRRIIKSIWPGIHEKDPDTKLVILGSAPPEWIVKMAENDEALIVTGFVQDVRPVLYSCNVCLIPLESGSGFRGRTVELLACGVPIIGTENALKSIKIEHGVNGIIAEADEIIIKWTLELLNNTKMCERISSSGKELVKQNYSLEATFGKLSEFFSNENL